MQFCDIIPDCYTIEDMCDHEERCCNLTYFGWEKFGVAWNMIYLLVSGLISWIFLLMIEFKVFWKMSYILGKKEIQSRDYTSVDSDVISEIKRIENMTPNEIMKHHLVMRALTKTIHNFVAVDQLSLGVES